MATKIISSSDQWLLDKISYYQLCYANDVGLRLAILQNIRILNDLQKYKHSAELKLWRNYE